MMWIPLQMVALGALVATSLRLCVAAHSSPLLLLAPGDLQASLTVSHDQSTSRWTAESSHGGILVVQTTSASVAVPNVDLANLSSIQATWTSASAPTSPTFHRLFGAAAPFSLPYLFSAGGHVRVSTTPSGGPNGLMEANALVRALLQAAPQPLLRLLPDLNGQNGASVLARSLCASAGFTRHEVSEQEACFSASFQHAHATVEELLPFHATLPDASPLLTALVLRPSPTDRATLTLDVVTASVTSLSALDSSAFSMADALTPRVMVVKQMDRESSVVPVVLVADGRETPQRIPRESATTAREISVAVVGEGFHRRVRVDLAPTTKLCPGHEMSKGNILLVVPLSTSVYADLDELRRMERFGELKLYAPTKHIEIERPTAVSSQHVIALEFPIDSAQLTHTLEFPIHLRYQSPSNSSFYASAVLVAPEVFVSCASEVTKEPSSYDGSLESLFSQWIHDAAWESTNWRRVAPPSPLTAVTVPVPVGFTPHGPLVSAITFSVTSLGALVLVYVAWKTSNRASKSMACMWKPKTP